MYLMLSPLHLTLNIQYPIFLYFTFSFLISYSSFLFSIFLLLTPSRMERSIHIDTLVSMSAKIIALSLKQVYW